jgi:SAM-dependent methyltransferase
VKRYDERYFERFYRDPRHRVTTPSALRRRVALVVAMAEEVMERRVESVLDVGCGEARWRAPLLELRPKLRYTGLETSEYALGRYARSRNIQPLRFADLAELRGRWDVVLCVDVLHYLAPREIGRGLAVIPSLVTGLAHLDVTTREDRPSGDLDGWKSRPRSWYERKFEEAGLAHIGMQCWIPATEAVTSPGS